VLVPGAPDRQLQCIDARDLADFVLHAIVSGAQGAFNVVAPPGFTTMAGLVQACAEAAGCQPADLRWIGDAQLLAQGITPWVDLPLWLPADGEMAAFMAVPTARAEAAGLTVRPLAQTVADTLAWWRALPAEAQAFVLAGLAPEREAAVLAAGAALGTAG
jgi:2'-hydroxyisoflavone reductase